MNIWKVISLNCRERYEEIDHRSYTENLSSCEIKAWKKNSHLSCSGLNFFQAKISIMSSCFSTVLIYDLSYIHSNSQCDQHPDGLIAHLVEHCTSIRSKSYLISQLLKLCVKLRSWSIMSSYLSLLNTGFTVVHFRVSLSLSIKTKPDAQPLIWKRV